MFGDFLWDGFREIEMKNFRRNFQEMPKKCGRKFTESFYFVKFDGNSENSESSLNSLNYGHENSQE